MSSRRFNILSRPDRTSNRAWILSTMTHTYAHALRIQPNRIAEQPHDGMVFNATVPVMPWNPQNATITIQPVADGADRHEVSVEWSSTAATSLQDLFWDDLDRDGVLDVLDYLSRR